MQTTSEPCHPYSSQLSISRSSLTSPFNANVNILWWIDLFSIVFTIFHHHVLHHNLFGPHKSCSSTGFCSRASQWPRRRRRAANPFPCRSKPSGFVAPGLSAEKKTSLNGCFCFMLLNGFLGLLVTYCIMTCTNQFLDRSLSWTRRVICAK